MRTLWRGPVVTAAIAAAAALAGLPVTAGHTSAADTFARTGRASPEVASVHDGALSLTDEVTGQSTVIARGPYQRELGSAIRDPGFSHDGRFVAYTETVGNTSEVQVVGVGGGRATTLEDAQSYAWSPVDDDLAVALPDRLELVSAAGTLLRRWVMTDPESAMFSPSGRYIAVGSRSSDSLRGYLHLLAVATTRAGAIAYDRWCDIPAAWSANGSRLLFWEDSGCSESLAADGQPLDSVAAATVLASKGGVDVSGIVKLGGSLLYPGWVLPLGGATVLVDAGGDRVAADHKALRTCNAATGACTAVPLPADATSLDPAVSKQHGTLFEVRVAQSKAMNDFLPAGTLWTSSLSGGPARELASAGRGVADPVPTANGSTVTFVRMTSVQSATVEMLTVSTGVVRAVAAVDPDDFYGEFMAPAVLALWEPRA